MNLLLVPELYYDSVGQSCLTVLSRLKICIDNFVLSLIFRSQVKDLQTMAHGLEVAQNPSVCFHSVFDNVLFKCLCVYFTVT